MTRSEHVAKHPHHTVNAILVRDVIQNSPDCEHAVRVTQTAFVDVVFYDAEPEVGTYATAGEWRVTSMVEVQGD